MHKVTQTILSEPDSPNRGNCFSAALASILDLRLDKVPYFAGMKEWYPPFCRFLRLHGHGFRGTYHFNEKATPPRTWADMRSKYKGVGGFYLAGGASWNDFVKAGHCVVLNSDGVLEHDPHPSGRGLKTLEYVFMIQPIDSIERGEDWTEDELED